MSQPHVIRLRGPWLCWTGPGEQPTEASVTIDFREEAGLSRLMADADHNARLWLERRFHCPTGLSATTSVQLVVASSIGDMTLTLNSRTLGSVAAGRHAFDVADNLKPANLLRIEMPTIHARDRRGLTDLFSCQLEIE